MPARTPDSLLDIFGGELKGLGNFKDGGLALKLLFQFGKGLIDLIDGSYLIERQPDNTRLFCKCL